MTDNNQPGKFSREDKKRLIKYGIAAAVILFILVAGLIDGTTPLAIPGMIFMWFAIPIACGYTMYGIWWLIMKIFTGRNINKEYDQDEWKYKSGRYR